MRVATRDRLTAARLWLPALKELEARLPDGVDGVCAESGLGRATLEDHRARLPLATALRFLRSATSATKDPLFSLRAGRRYDRGTFDLFMRALLAQPDAHAAMASASRLASIPVEGLEIAYVREEGRQRAVFTIDGAPIDDANLAEYVVGLTGCIASQIGGAALRVLDVEFVHAPRADARAYRDAVGAPVSFGSSRSSLSLPDVDLALPDADPVLATLLVDQAEAMLESQPRTRTQSGRVEAFLAARLGEAEVALPDAARALGMSERTLKRRLADEGKTFGALLDELRKSRSMELLSDEALSIGEVGFAVGFASAGAFRRAFTRWTGKSPRSYRAGREA